MPSKIKKLLLKIEDIYKNINGLKKDLKSLCLEIIDYVNLFVFQPQIHQLILLNLNKKIINHCK